MAASKPTFEEFMFDVHPALHPFVARMHERLTLTDCTFELKMAKSGYVASYAYKKTKRVVLNYVFRKKGMLARVYGDYACRDQALIDSLPEAVAKSVAKAPVCKRLIDPMSCSSNCPMGYTFEIDGELKHKCRYNCFLILLDDVSMPAVEALIEAELAGRAAAV